MEAPPTIRDVARLAGVSVSTVSYVLNDYSDKFVSEELRQRVIQAAKVLNYRPNQIARRLRGKTGRMLAVLIPQFDNLYFTRIAIGAQQVADERGYILCIYSSYDSEEREMEFILNILSQQVDGILLCPANNHTKSVDMIRQSNTPFCVVDRQIPGSDFDFVAIENYQAAYDATEYLINKGHERIAYCSWGTTIDAVVKRKRGFLAAVEKHKLSDRIMIWEYARDQESVYREGIDHIVKIIQPTALLIGQHQVAEGIIRSMKRFTPSRLKDLSIVVFGDPPWATMTQPEVTCITPPSEEMGKAAMELLIARIENPELEPQRVYLRAELVERGSVKLNRY